MKIGIVNSGGDCAGLNAVIASVVRTASFKDIECVGFEKGWEGVLDNQIIPLSRKTVSGISHLGGTVLHTINKGRFAGKKGSGSVNQIPQEVIDEAVSNIKNNKVDCLIVIGGDGTLSGALQLQEAGVPIVGIPKSIDNDLSSTDSTFGFSTAVDVAVEAIDKIHTTATSHGRVFFIECMGRHAGWISLYAGLAANASGILLPEFPVNLDTLVEFFLERQKSHGYSIIVVSEGVSQFLSDTSGADTPELKLHGASENLMATLKNKAGDQFEMRNVVLGHLQRGGNPNAYDRILAKRYGIAAVEAVMDQKFGEMVRLRGTSIDTVSIKEAVGKLHLVTKENHIYQTAKKLGLYIN